MSLRILLVCDVHGAIWNLRPFLRRLGVIDEQDRRRPEWFTLQLGDLIHGGLEPDEDSETVRGALVWFDPVLLGNHVPHLSPCQRLRATPAARRRHPRRSACCATRARPAVAAGAVGG